MEKCFKNENQKNCAVQVMNFEDSEDPLKPRSVKFYKENLQQCLNQAGDRKVCIVSIAGPSRQGKSFFLSFLIRYLEALEKDESDWLDWENKEIPLSGFKWTTATEHETKGMLVWSKPFIVKSNGQEIAVLLMDTQGTYDDETTNRERSAIIGLSLLMSSCLIFNFFDLLQEDCLESLHTYVNFGLMAMNAEEIDGMTHPFQRLYFLIRDWRMPTQHPFGAEGGQQYLKKKLEITSKMSSSGIKVRETLHKCFKRMDCFLMPGIGENAQQIGFTGCLSQLSDKFSKKMEELVEDLLSPDDLNVKSVFGNEVIATDVLNCFEQYVNVFNCEDIPAPLDLIETTSKIAFQSIVSQCVRKYLEEMKKKLRGKQFISESVLNQTSQLSKKNSIDYFEKARVIGTPEMANLFKEDLSQLLKSEFYKIYSENEKKRGRFVDEAMSESLRIFQNSIDEEFPDEVTFLKSNKLQILCNSAKANALLKFRNKLEEDLDAEDLMEQMKHLENKLDDEEQKASLDNENRLRNAEQRMDQLVETLANEYSTRVNEKLLKNPFLPNDEVAIIITKEKNATDETFETIKAVGGKFVINYAKKLQDSIFERAESIVQSHKLTLQEAEKNANLVLDSTLMEFENDLTEKCNQIWEESELESKCKTLSQQSILAIQENIRVPKDAELAKNILLKAKQRLKVSSDRILKNFPQLKRDCEESYSKAVESSLKWYVMKMDQLLKNKLYSQGSLENHHEEIKVQAIQAFHYAPKKGNHPEPKKFLTELETKITDVWNKIAETNKIKREAFLANVRITVNSLVQKYNSDMTKDLDSIKDLDDLDKHHQTGLNEAQENFNKAYTGDHFAEPFLTKLADELNKAYEDLKDYFDLMLNYRDSTTKDVLEEARRVYKNEMKKHYKNNVFMRPAGLQALHEQLVSKAISECNTKGPLNEIQMDELKSALEFTYQQYKEKNNMNIPVDPAIGIDLGTTYSCVAVYLNGKVKVIPNAQGTNTTPSYVCYNKAGSVRMIGQPAKSKAYDYAENTIYDAKRIIGRDFLDPKLQADMKFWPFKVVKEDKVPKIRINSGKTLHPEEVSSEMLKAMRKNAEDFLNCKVSKAVITVPAYFTDGQRQATIDAGKIAGLEVLKILNEPTSAAIAYKLQHSEEKFRHVLIYDLGGGTFDVAVLKISEGNIEALAVEGDTHLGGQDFDQKMMEHCCLEFHENEGINLMEGKDSSNATERNNVRRRLHRLQQACEEGKTVLSSDRTTNIDVPAIYNENMKSLDLKVLLTRAKFEELNNAHFKRTLDLVDQALVSAKLNKSNIDDIVLVGGSTRIPKVQKLLQEHFEGKALNKAIHPDEAVAVGAAVQAAILNGKIVQESIHFNTIADVTPMSLGIEIVGEVFSCIIPKSTKIPVKIKHPYFTTVDNQKSGRLRIFQGEEKMALKNKRLGEFTLANIPPAPAGKEQIDVTMEINLQGVLKVVAACKSTGETNSVKITEDKHRMSQSTIKKILAEAKARGA